MAGLYEKPSETYSKKRPRYPKEWFSMLASLTAGHHRAWDAGCGSGQASVSIAEHYDGVVATDVSEGQLRHAIAHPKVRYLHTPEDLPEDDLVALVGGEGSLDLVIVATAIHWFDVPRFYAVVNRVLKKPGGVLAVWGYNYDIHPFGEKLQGALYPAMRPYMDPRTRLAMERYRELPFPFEPVGVGREGEPADVDMEAEMTLEDLAGFVMTGSVATTAREKGVDLEALVKGVMKEVEAGWGDQPTVPRKLGKKSRERRAHRGAGCAPPRGVQRLDVAGRVGPERGSPSRALPACPIARLGSLAGFEPGRARTQARIASSPLPGRTTAIQFLS